MNIASFFHYPNQATEPGQPDLVLLSDWSPQQWNKFFRLTQTLRFNAGDVVFQQGDEERAFYLVAAGQFELLINRGASELRQSIVGLGSVLGEQTFLDAYPSAATVRALTDGELVRFGLEAYETFHAREPDLAGQLVWDLARIVSLRHRQTSSLITV